MSLLKTMARLSASNTTGTRRRRSSSMGRSTRLSRATHKPRRAAPSKGPSVRRLTRKKIF